MCIAAFVAVCLLKPNLIIGFIKKMEAINQKLAKKTRRWSNGRGAGSNIYFSNFGLIAW